MVGECQDGAETIRALGTHKLDLLLLDIHMPDLNGFEVLSRIAAEEIPIVVFTTAYDCHAVRAFEAHALDYLLKPIDTEDLWVVDDLAYETGKYTYTYRLVGKEENHIGGHYVTVWKKQSDGGWRIAADMGVSND